MTRYERRMFFERLCQLRDRSARAGRLDRETVCSVDEVIDWASAIMAALELEAVAATKGAKG